MALGAVDCYGHIQVWILHGPRKRVVQDPCCNGNARERTGNGWRVTGMFIPAWQAADDDILSLLIPI